MAITVAYSSPDYQPAFNRLPFVVESTNVAQTDFRFICDVYINGSSTKAIRLTLFPDENLQGVFYIERVLADYLEANLNSPTFTGFALNRDHYVSYILKFGEEYGGTVYADLTITSSQKAIMSALSFNQGQAYDYTDYLMDGVYLGKFLTNSPRTLKARRNGYAELHFLNEYSNEAYSLRIRTYLPNGSLIDTYTIDNDYSAASSSQKWCSVGVGIYNLNNATLSSGSQLVVDDDAASYDVCLVDSGNNVSSEIITFEIDETCSRYDGKHVKFLNRMGGFDTFFFGANENTYINVTNRGQYTKLVGSVTGSPDTWGYNLSDRGKKTYSVDAQERTELKSGFLTEDESEWLKELITSPEVYVIETYNGTVYNRPINITNSDYEIVYKRNKKMFQLNLTYEYAHKENIQTL